MLDTVIAYDQKLLLFFNNLYHNEYLDQFFLFITDFHNSPLAVIIALGFLFWGLYRKYRMQLWRPLLLLLVCVGLADLICYRVIKANVARTRPFQTEAIQDQVRKAGIAHGSSFPSNHAANSFAGATALSYIFPNLTIFFFVYASLVAFSRVYLGVHYPIDVATGALIGFVISVAMQRFFRKQLTPSTKANS